MNKKWFLKYFYLGPSFFVPSPWLPARLHVLFQVSGNIMLVSGNILSSAENEERIRCHFQGKQYLGWRAVRDKLKELKEKLTNRPIRYGWRAVV